MVENLSLTDEEKNKAIKNAISSVDMDFQVAAYVELMEKIDSDIRTIGHISLVTRLAFEAYYDMTSAKLSRDWKDKYFDILSTYLCASEDFKKTLTLDVLMTEVGSNGNSVQPSFLSKLLHTVNIDAPIYDSKVRKFLQTGNVSGKSVDDRRTSAVEIYEKRIKNFYSADRYVELRTLMLTVFNEKCGQIKKCWSAENIGVIKKLDFVLWALGKNGKKITEFMD